MNTSIACVSFDTIISKVVDKNPKLKEWFDLDNLSIFDTSLPRTALVHKKYGCVYFITGELHRRTGKSLYTVRVINARGVSLVSEFQEFSTYNLAEKWLYRYLAK